MNVFIYVLGMSYHAIILATFTYNYCYNQFNPSPPE